MSFPNQTYVASLTAVLGSVTTAQNVRACQRDHVACMAWWNGELQNLAQPDQIRDSEEILAEVY